MERGDIDAIAKLLTEIKNSINELESAQKKKDSAKFLSAKNKIINLQMQISKRI